MIRACVAVGLFVVVLVADVNARPALAVDRGAIESLVRREAVRLGVPVPLALAVAHAESYFDARAESNCPPSAPMRQDWGID